jgi:hypothetical protein
MSTLLFALSLSFPAFAADSDAVVSTGQFTFKIAPIDLTARPGKGNYQAIVGFQITNTGSVPVRLALVPAWPTLQLAGVGVNFTLRSNGVTGIPWYGDGRASQCSAGADNFVVVRPTFSVSGNLVLDVGAGDVELAMTKRGRFSGNLMVQSLDDKKCWLEAFGISDVAVNAHL